MCAAEHCPQPHLPGERCDRCQRFRVLVGPFILLCRGGRDVCGVSEHVGTQVWPEDILNCQSSGAIHLL